MRSISSIGLETRTTGNGRIDGTRTGNEDAVRCRSRRADGTTPGASQNAWLLGRLHDTCQSYEK